MNKGNLVLHCSATYLLQNITVSSSKMPMCRKRNRSSLGH